MNYLPKQSVSPHDIKTSNCELERIVERNQLVEDYLLVVKGIAWDIFGKVPPSVEFDDLISNGVLGLIDAVEKFDSERRVLLETYARKRINGAIYDYLREEDHLSRYFRDKYNQFLRAEDKLFIRGEELTTENISQEMELTLKQYYNFLVDTALCFISIEDIGGTNKRGVSRNFYEVVSDPEALTPEELLTQNERYHIFLEEFESLCDRHKTVLELYYKEGLLKKEIGEILNVTPSRISQLHKIAIKKLKQRVQRRIKE